jgi:hypothetical protein
VNESLEPPRPAEPVSTGFAFTDPGCRTEVRLGALLVLAAVFLWLFFGPVICSRIFMIGGPLLLIGVPIQALQARRDGRPGYPTKLGLVMAWGGIIGLPDLRYREAVGGPIETQPVGPLLAAAGLWILMWWPVARSRRQEMNA